MENSKALTTVTDLEAMVSVSPIDMAPALFEAGLERRKANRDTLIKWVREALVEGVDFGSILTKRGLSRPSLWKPGAEKILGMMNLVASFPNLRDYEAAALSGVEIKTIILRCEILGSHGVVLAEGSGARTVAQDFGDLNKSLKMAKKSAMIDGTLCVGGLSEVFTQDIEDMQPATKEPVTIGPAGTAEFLEWSDKKGIPRPHVLNAAKKYHGVDTLDALTKDQARELAKHLIAPKPPTGPVDNSGPDGHPTDDSQASEQPSAPDYSQVQPPDQAFLDNRAEVAAASWEAQRDLGEDPAETFGVIIPHSMLRDERSALEKTFRMARSADMKWRMVTAAAGKLNSLIHGDEK